MKDNIDEVPGPGHKSEESVLYSIQDKLKRAVEICRGIFGEERPDIIKEELREVGSAPYKHIIHDDEIIVIDKTVGKSVER